MYHYGNGIDIDYDKAMNWYLKAAAQGQAAAQANLGTIYLHGQGVQIDYAEAYSWFLNAAKQGDPGGFFNLGQLYDYGLHVPKDNIKAYAYYSITLLEESELSAMALESLTDLKVRMTPAEIQAGEREAKKLMRKYGLGG
jgi:TPR repeat protein